MQFHDIAILIIKINKYQSEQLNQAFGWLSGNKGRGQAVEGETTEKTLGALRMKENILSMGMDGSFLATRIVPELEIAGRAFPLGVF